MTAGPSRLVAGVDEAGRGTLAGPVCAAAVILASPCRIRGLADSKQLPAVRREILATRIRERALAWAVACASVEEIDRFNIARATLLAMRRAVEALGIAPHEVWVDGSHCPRLAVPTRAIVGGDALHPVISAASILAKTARDARMQELHARHPQYGFDRHKGYATPEHRAALARYGPSEAHRRSFRPVRAFFEPDLFARP